MSLHSLRLYMLETRAITLLDSLPMQRANDTLADLAAQYGEV